MIIKKKKRIRYYNSYEDDFVTSSKQDYKLKDTYKWIHKNIFYIILSYILYWIIFVIAFIYSKLILKVKVRNKKVLKGYKSYYLYGNHTQEIGDIFDIPSITFPKRPYYICSPSNLGIPILGKLLPFVGALPIPSSIDKMKEYKEAIHKRDKNHPIIIYPEAHVWPYCTFIRDFPSTSFHFPVEGNIPVFVMTRVYKKNKRNKLRIEIIIDGPFNIKENLSKKENIQYLRDIVYETMVKRSSESNYQYIEYKKKEE